jgi:hypothetical protein
VAAVGKGENRGEVQNRGTRFKALENINEEANDEGGNQGNSNIIVGENNNMKTTEEGHLRVKGVKGKDKGGKPRNNSLEVNNELNTRNIRQEKSDVIAASSELTRRNKSTNQRKERGDTNITSSQDNSVRGHQDHACEENLRPIRTSGVNLFGKDEPHHNTRPPDGPQQHMKSHTTNTHPASQGTNGGCDIDAVDMEFVPETLPSVQQNVEGSGMILN